MRADIAHDGRLQQTERSRPEVGPGEVSIRVHATALNRADLLQRRGKYAPPPGATDVLGLECAGVVEAVGEGVAERQIGDRVMALLPGGGYAEYVTAPVGHTMPIPAGLDFEAAAAIPEVFLTAFQALFWLGELRRGERVLLHAGASGVGTAAIQLARAAGAEAYVTASEAKHAACLDLGARAAYDYRAGDWAEHLRAEGISPDVIVDVIGAPYFDKNVDVLARDGRIVLLALMGGHRLEHISLVPFFRKRATLRASTLRNRSDAYKADLVADFTDRFLSAFEHGNLRPVIDRIMPWDEAEEAHAHMEANANVGKIILRVRA